MTLILYSEGIKKIDICYFFLEIHKCIIFLFFHLVMSLSLSKFILFIFLVRREV
jgi:hypothetical protein